MASFHTMLYRKLDDILRSVNPRKSIIFAVDGPAPLAKLLTQRSRRKASQTSNRPIILQSLGVLSRDRRLHDAKLYMPHLQSLFIVISILQKAGLPIPKRHPRTQKNSLSEERKGNGGNGPKPKKARQTVISSTALTPGTPFMHDVELSLTFYVCSRLLANKYRHLHMELSGPTVKGEGAQCAAMAGLNCDEGV